MDAPSRHTVTRLLQDVSAGQGDALDALLPLVYAEMRRRAASFLRRERRNHTLQATALVNEAYLRLVDQQQVRWQNRAHFFAIAAQAMRRILVDHARRRHRAKREGVIVPLDDVEPPAASRGVDLLALDEALDRLASRDRQQSRIVELRYFGGLSIEETAEVLGVSPATVKRDWAMARAWLHEQMRREGP
jgi:RNA polymerase sigma factor (TIGR02999 family)